jgi:hypothetical protein
VELTNIIPASPDPGNASWTIPYGFQLQDDNEGLMAIARKTAELIRLNKLEHDRTLAALEIEPIQDRVV